MSLVYMFPDESQIDTSGDVAPHPGDRVRVEQGLVSPDYEPIPEEQIGDWVVESVEQILRQTMGRMSWIAVVNLRPLGDIT